MVEFLAVAIDQNRVEIHVLNQKKLISTLDGDVAFDARSELRVSSGQQVTPLDQGKYEIDGKVYLSHDPLAP